MMHFLDVAVAFLNSALGAAGTIALVVEFILRAIPSQKPLSILLAISAGVKLVGEVIGKIGVVFKLVSDLLDKVLQNVKPQDPSAPAV